MKIDVLTLFPAMFEPLQHSIIGKAQEASALTLGLHDFREFAVNKHGHVDDYPYGGGAGMLLRVEPIVEQLEQLRTSESRVILVDPIGIPFSQELAVELAQEEHLIFVCGHYEGFDERIRSYVDDEISLGNYVLTNGELPAMVMIDATVRLRPEVLGNAESIVEESYSAGLLEQPQYTRPPEYRGQAVPPILLSGDHGKIARWRHKEALRRTYERRPDLLEERKLTKEEEQLLEEIKSEE